MMNRLVKGIVLGVIGLLGLATPNVFATTFSGSLSTPSGLTGIGDYASGSSISWTVNDTVNPGFWTYTYTFTNNNRNMDYILIEVSNGSDPFVSANLAAGSTTPAATYPKLHTTDSVPSSVYSLRYNPPGGSHTLTVTIVTQRQPVWGDFFAKGVGSDHRVFNAGFTSSDTDPTSDPSIGSVDHILVPDTIDTGT